MKKFLILALVVVLTMCVMAGCRNRAVNETSVPTTVQTVPTTTAVVRPSTHPTTQATIPSTTDNFMTDASEAIDDIIDGTGGTGNTTETGSARSRTAKRG